MKDGVIGEKRVLVTPVKRGLIRVRYREGGGEWMFFRYKSGSVKKKKNFFFGKHYSLFLMWFWKLKK